MSERPRVWPAPIVIGALSLIGLVAALVADGAGDALAWLTLGAPVAVCAWHSFRRRRSE